MKEFKLYVWLSEDNMTEVLHSGLKNDPAVETFYIRSVNQAGLAFPTRYVKIEPLSCVPRGENCTIADFSRQCARAELSHIHMVCRAERHCG